jgi:hypothetical protein
MLKKLGSEFYKRKGRSKNCERIIGKDPCDKLGWCCDFGQNR